MKRLMLVCVMILCLITVSAPVSAESPLDWLFSLFAEPNQSQEAVGMTHAETVAAFRDLGIVRDYFGQDPVVAGGTGISLGHFLDHEDFFQIPTPAGHVVGGIQSGVETDGISLLVHQLSV